MLAAQELSVHGHPDRGAETLLTVLVAARPQETDARKRFVIRNVAPCPVADTESSAAGIREGYAALEANNRLRGQGTYFIAVICETIRIPYIVAVAFDLGAALPARQDPRLFIQMINSGYTL